MKHQTVKIKNQTANHGFTPHQKNGSFLGAGFTLVETLVAIMVLALALNALFTLITSSIFYAKYANNEITATYLAQEAIDYIRNDRDTIAFQNNDWNTFLLKYGYDIGTQTKTNCFSTDGCSFDATKNLGIQFSSNDIYTCGSSCNKFYYNPRISNTIITSYYTYESTNSTLNLNKTSFERRIQMEATNNGNEVDVIVEVKWLNGSNPHTRTLTTSLLKWR